MSQESLILLDECPFPSSKDSQGEGYRLHFITRTSFDSVFPNKQVPIYLPEPESICLSLSPEKNKEIKKPVLKFPLYKEGFQQQRRDREEDDYEEEGYSYESYDPDDPDFEIPEEELSSEAIEDENIDDAYSEENILQEEGESQSEEDKAESVEGSVSEEVHFKTEGEAEGRRSQEEEESKDSEDKDIKRQELLFLNRKGQKAHVTAQEVNKGKRYRLYHDWKILKATDYYAAKHGPSILNNEAFWQNLRDPETGRRLLGNTRYSSSIFNRYKRRLQCISEETKERIYKLVERLSKQDMLNYYCEFCRSEGPVCFVGVKRVGSKSKYLLREISKAEVIPQKLSRQVRNSLVAPNCRCCTRANIHLCYETDDSFTAGESADVSETSEEEKEKEILSGSSEESNEANLTNENVLNLASASQPVFRREESDFWRSPSVPSRTVRYGASQPVIQDEDSRETVLRKRLVRMRERSPSLEITNKKKKRL